MAKGASMRPDDFTEGSGLLDNADVTWKEVRCVMWDYDGRGPESPAVCVTMEDEDGDEVEQYYSVGKATDWEPNEEGTEFIAIGNASGFNKNSNIALLLSSVVEAGFPVEKLGTDFTVFEGMKAHMVRQEVERKGLKKAPREDGREYAQTVLVVEEIHELPGGNKGGGKKAKSGGKGKGKTEAEEAGEGEEGVEEKAAGLVMEVLGDETKPITLKSLAAKVHKAAGKDGDRAEMVKLVMKGEFHEDQPWEYDGKKKVVSMGD